MIWNDNIFHGNDIMTMTMEIHGLSLPTSVLGGGAGAAWRDHGSGRETTNRLPTA